MSQARVGTRQALPAVLEAELTWTGSRFERGVRVAIDDAGRIEAVGALEREPTMRLRRRALIPGLVNAHSHAFQIGLRGRSEGSASAMGSFWTWRDAMYELALSLDRHRFRALCARAFREMRDAGITAVGEFHYLHHATADRDGSFDEALLDAAAETGIRLVLLQAYYETGGIGRAPGPTQQRFSVGSMAEYWERFDRLAERIDPATHSLGVAPHSIRAVARDDLVALHAEARRRGLPVHMHVEEQRGEIEECVAAYGVTPMALLLESLSSFDGMTAVHCTHTRPVDLEAFAGRGGAVCVCPLTEGNLGDGIPDLSSLTDSAGRICLGTDSNLRIDLSEEMRWLEYGQRLRHERRGILAGDDDGTGATLLASATRAGAAALGVPAGAIAPGLWADLAALDLDAPALRDCDDDALLDAWIFGADAGAVAATSVGGRWRDTGQDANARR